MTTVIAWLTLIPAAIVLAALMIGPGAVALRTCGVRALPAIALGPAITAFCVGGATILLRKVLLPYGWVPFVAIVLALWLLAWLCAKKILRGRGGEAHETSETLGAKSVLPALALAMAVSLLPVVLGIDVSLPSQQSDALYHYNALNAIENTGNASMFGAMNFNYGIRTLSVVYPSVWHAIVVLVSPVAGEIVAANAMSLIVTPIVFFLGLAWLVETLFGRSFVKLVLVFVFAAAFTAFPNYLIVGKAFWPNSLALAMLPAVYAAFVAWSRTILRWNRQALVTTIFRTVTIAMAVLGVALTHPTAVYTLIWVLLPAGCVFIYELAGKVRAAVEPRTFIVLSVSTVVIAVGGIAAFFIPKRTRTFMSRELALTWGGLPEKVGAVLFNWPVGSRWPTLAILALFYIPLLVLGIRAALRRRPLRWAVWAWGMQAILTAASLVPIPLVSQFSGLWYADTYRLLAVQAVFSAILLALGTATAMSLVRSLSFWGEKKPGAKRFVVAGIIVSLVGMHVGVGSLLSYMGFQDNVSNDPAHTMVTADERVLMERLDSRIPQGSIFVGDPAGGAAFIPLYSSNESVHTQLNVRSLDRDGNYLTEHFDQIGRDPQVCTILRHYGIGYFYEDAALRSNPGKRAELMPGFYKVDTSQGFTLVDRQGTASIWRIDACGEPKPGDGWWEARWRRLTVTN